MLENGSFYLLSCEIAFHRIGWQSTLVTLNQQPPMANRTITHRPQATHSVTLTPGQRYLVSTNGSGFFRITRGILFYIVIDLLKILFNFVVFSFKILFCLFNLDEIKIKIRIFFFTVSCLFVSQASPSLAYLIPIPVCKRRPLNIMYTLDASLLFSKCNYSR